MVAMAHGKTNIFWHPKSKKETQNKTQTKKHNANVELDEQQRPQKTPN